MGSVQTPVTLAGLRGVIVTTVLTAGVVMAVLEADSQVATSDETTAGSAPESRDAPWLPLVALIVTLLPQAVAAARAVRSGWVPVGDSALLSIRSHDVLGSGELPLVGMWSARSWDINYHVHHPGPLFFDLLALPTRLVPGPAGYVLGAALVNSAAAVAIFLLAQRRAGRLAALGALAVTGALTWSMGSAVLVEPWTVNTMLLPFLCYCLLAWSVADGDIWCVPWAAFVGSLLLQANLAFSLLVPGLAVFAAVALLRFWWHPRSRDRYGVSRPESHRVGATRSIPSRWRRPAVVTALALGLAWARPLYEQFFGAGEGNLTLLVRSSSEPQWYTSAPDAVRTVAKITALPPWWGRPSYAEALPHAAFGNPLPPLPLAILALTVLGGLLAWGARAAWHRGDRTTSRLAAAGLAVLVLSLASAKSTPSSAVGSLDYQLRWLWPAAAFIAFALTLCLAQQSRGLLVSRERGERRRWLTIGLAALIVLFAVLNLPENKDGAAMPASTLPVAQHITQDVTAADLDGPLLVTCIEGVADPYCEAVLAELQRHDVAFVMDEADDVALRQLGQERRWDGTNAKAELLVVSGDPALEPPPSGFREISAHYGLSQGEQDELDGLREELNDALATGALRLNDRGRRVAERGDLESVDADADSERSSSLTIDSELAVDLRESLLGPHRRDVVGLAEEDLLETNDDMTARLRRYAELQSTWDEQTVAVFLGPVPDEEMDP